MTSSTVDMAAAPVLDSPQVYHAPAEPDLSAPGTLIDPATILAIIEAHSLWLSPPRAAGGEWSAMPRGCSFPWGFGPTAALAVLSFLHKFTHPELYPCPPPPLPTTTTTSRTSRPSSPLSLDDLGL